jgi:hypothetical protein
MIWTFFGHIFLVIFARNLAQNSKELLDCKYSLLRLHTLDATRVFEGSKCNFNNEKLQFDQKLYRRIPIMIAIKNPNHITFRLLNY